MQTFRRFTEAPATQRPNLFYLTQGQLVTSSHIPSGNDVVSFSVSVDNCMADLVLDGNVK